LAALEAAHPLPVGTLDASEAVRLLSTVAGGARTAAEPEAAATIAELCGRLPLAVRIAGARIANRPHWRLSRMATRLADERLRLDELSAGDLAVRASLATSYLQLDPEDRTAVRRLVLLDAPDAAAWAVA